MRLYSIHPKYLDKAGLGGCWRESLLAQKVLMGMTVGYRDHPQLIRFKAVKRTLDAIGMYLYSLWSEADSRKWSYDGRKIHRTGCVTLTVTQGQVDFEVRHLQKKLLCRDFKKCCELTHDRLRKTIQIHPLFVVVDGAKERWEKG